VGAVVEIVRTEGLIAGLYKAHRSCCAPVVVGFADFHSGLCRDHNRPASVVQGVGTTVIRASLLTSAQMASYDESKHFLIDSLAFSDNFLAHFWFEPPPH
jgi:hypothetical protein